MQHEILCKTCDAGQLRKRKRYRMSGVVVLIGYILLFPSLMGVAVATMGVVATGTATQEVAGSIKREIEARLGVSGVPPAISQHVLTQQTVSQSELNQLTEAQRLAVQQARLQLSAGTVGVGAGAALAGGASFLFGVFSLIGGLLGWLLVMKKSVLQCSSCGAVVAAS